MGEAYSSCGRIMISYARGGCRCVCGGGGEGVGGRGSVLELISVRKSEWKGTFLEPVELLRPLS